MPLDEAQAALRSLKLEWSIEWVLSTSAEQDLVLEQTPGPGNDAVAGPAGSPARRQRPNRVVPELVGLCREEAEDRVAAAGFTCRVEFTQATHGWASSPGRPRRAAARPRAKW